MEKWIRWGALGVPLFVGACTGDGGTSGIHGDPDGGEDVEPAHAGVCFGEGTRCDAPLFEPLTPGSPVDADCSDGEAATMQWTHDLGTFECVLPACPAADAHVAADAGKYWAVSELSLPRAEPGGDAVGFAVTQLDESGTTRFSAPSDVHRRIDGTYYPAQITRDVDVDSSGRLRWLLPSPDGKGLDLRLLATDGRVLSNRTALSGTVAIAGDAAWLSDGSVVVTYRFTDVPDGTIDDKLFSGAARFDPAGRLLWNQTLFAESLKTDPTISGMPIRIVGERAGLGVVIRALIERTDTTSTGLLTLDAHGNVVSARELQDATFPGGSADASARALDDDSIVLGYQAPSSSNLDVERFAEDGTSMGHVHGSYGDAIVFDRDGRAVTLEQSTPPSVTVLDAMMGTCVSHVLDPGDAASTHGATSPALTASLALTANGGLFFGSGQTIGLVRLP
jgi:hypothetical protein